ncbi:MAG TPA: hypothetical protein VIU02_11760 [Burkholderiales bacterium]
MTITIDGSSLIFSLIQELGFTDPMRAMRTIAAISGLRTRHSNY